MTVEQKIVRRKVKEELQVLLTNDEKLEISAAMSESISRKRNLEDELKSYSTSKKAEIQAHDSEITKSSELIRRGYDYRRVECELVFDYVAGIKTLTRLDTGEIVYTKKIQGEEAQLNLMD